ncbi:hypothetical protein X777_03661 [Ooceraea biroi]|uniref:Uncharacterized protein n=1 Tax=Ooceraea biroi TaxID=2015173 RepID=A0A026WJZ2_OOCBI|nr:hypothetical protein X777_03661 [Ooceraea biroi]
MVTYGVHVFFLFLPFSMKQHRHVSLVCIIPRPKYELSCSVLSITLAASDIFGISITGFPTRYEEDRKDTL